MGGFIEHGAGGVIHSEFVAPIVSVFRSASFRKGLPCLSKIDARPVAVLG
jgi:hypothetical protein